MATREAYWRTLDHLKANEVNLDETKPVVGPLLHIDPKHEMVTHPEQVVADAANNCLIRKRTGRAPFIVPDMQQGAVATV